MVEVSLVICCYNSSQRLPDTLSHLKAQDAPRGTWEVIVVDNASTDDTAKVATECWSAGGPVPLRVVLESRPGIAYARTRGLREAKGRSVCFVDDDNWLAPSWVRLAAEIMSTHPTIGALGSRGEPVPEGDLPKWFADVERAYAVGLQAPFDGDVTGAVSHFWGAGLTIRKEFWEQIDRCGFVPFLKGHSGTEIVGGADTELVLALGLAGKRLWYDHRLVFQHFIPKAKLNWAYVRRLHRGFGTSGWVREMYMQEGADPDKWDFTARSWAAWIYHVITAGVGIASLVVRSPRTTLRGTEGSEEVLKLDRTVGRFVSLLSARGDFIRFRRSVLRLKDRLASLVVDTHHALS